jgi:putative phosphoesterase
MKLGIISDTHDRTDWVERALVEFRRRGVDRIIHCGDVTEPNTVDVFAGWATDFVLGNCDWQPGILETAISQIGATLHKPFGELTLGGTTIAWIHSDDAGLFHSLEHADHYDYLFYGHTHVAEQHRSGKTLVINPGALHRVRIRTCAVLDVGTGALESIVLGR